MDQSGERCFETLYLKGYSIVSGASRADTPRSRRQASVVSPYSGFNRLRVRLCVKTSSAFPADTANPDESRNRKK